MVRAATSTSETNGRLLELSQRAQPQETAGLYTQEDEPPVSSTTLVPQEDAVPAESIITQVCRSRWVRNCPPATGLGSRRCSSRLEWQLNDWTPARVLLRRRLLQHCLLFLLRESGCKCDAWYKMALQQFPFAFKCLEAAWHSIRMIWSDHLLLARMRHDNFV